MQLTWKLGEMPETELSLSDLDMIRLMEEMDPRMNRKSALQFLQRYLCADGEEIRQRSLLLGELFEKSSQEEVDALAADLAALSEEKRKYDQASDRIHTLLYAGRRMEIYVRCVEKIFEMASRGFTSPRMQELREETGRIRLSEPYEACVKALKEHRERIVFPKSIRVGINTQEDAHPVEMGVLSDNAEVEPLNPLIGMEDPSIPARSLFPEMIYNRERYGTHFEEYLTGCLEKRWKGKLSKALEIWKKVEAPQEQRLWSLAEDFAFYAVGLRVMNAFAKRGYRLCRPQITDEELLKADWMVYPELALNGESIQGNCVSLTEGGAVIVTGANHSGKTSYLKTVGQILLLAQLGFYVPAEKMAFRPVRRIFTLFSAGEDASMSASRMGVEIRILAEMLDQVTQSDLVLINEPLTSTNPVEAVSICSDLICRFLEKRVTNLTVTHLYDVYFLLRSKLSVSQQAMLKSLVTQARYEEDRGMIYSYRLIESEPLGNSYARETAEAFGVTLPELIPDSGHLEKAAAFCTEESLKVMYMREEADHGISD